LVFFQVQDDGGSSANIFTGGVGFDGETSGGSGFPDELFIVVVFGDDGDRVSNQVSGVESDTELTDHTDISASLEGFHESFGSGLGNGTQVVDQVGLGHTDTGVSEDQLFLFFVWDDIYSHIFHVLEGVWVCQRLVSDFVQSIGGVGDQFSEKDFFVGVKGVNDQGHQLGDFGLEGESLDIGLFLDDSVDLWVGGGHIDRIYVIS
jgi:hypothetical protein